MTAMQIEEVVRHANRAGYDDVVFAGFRLRCRSAGRHPELGPP